MTLATRSGFRAQTSASNRFAAWLVGMPAQDFSTLEFRATIAMFLIIGFCFNSLPPFVSIGSLADPAEGSWINQVFWTGIFLFAASIFIAQNSRSARGTYGKALPLLVLCLLLFASTLWSLAPLITMKRAILQFFVVTSVLVSVSSLKRADQAFVILYRVAAITLVFEFAMVLNPLAFDEDGRFRGIHSHKNVLGYVGVMAIFCGIWVRRSGISNLNSKHWNTAYLLCWLVFAAMSQSKTSLSLLVVAPAVALGLRELARTLRLGLSTVLIVLSALLYAAFSVAFILGVNIGSYIEDSIHRIGFTGRDDIWDFLIARLLEQPWLGYGYGGFWDIGPASPVIRYASGFLTTLNQAHNGYLDLLLALGVAGLVTYAFVFASFLFSLTAAERKARSSAIALCWTLTVFFIMHNFTETTLLRGYGLVWVVQVIAMVTVFRMAHESTEPT